jgi:hypothetical protein
MFHIIVSIIAVKRKKSEKLREISWEVEKLVVSRNVGLIFEEICQKCKYEYKEKRRKGMKRQSVAD